MTTKDWIGLIKSAADKWSERKAPRLGASLAYYTLLSLAPLMILIVTIVGVVFGEKTAESEVLVQARELVGMNGANTLKMLIDNAHHPGTGIFASIVAIVTLLFGASGVFVELRDSLNEIWDAPPAKSSSWRSLVWQRVASFGMVLAVGFLLLVSLVLTAAFAVIEKFFTGFVPIDAVILEVINFVLSSIAIGVLIALIFKFVPEVPIGWRDVMVGAGATAVLFIVGKSLLALYLSTAGVGSTYGAAGSLVALVVWVYYSAQIFLFGAIFTRVYALAYGTKRNGNPARSNSSGVAAGATRP